MDWSACPAVDRNQRKPGGAWCFAGTRVPVVSLFEHLGKGSKIDQFLEWFPDVTAEQVHQVLAFAKTRYVQSMLTTTSISLPDDLIRDIDRADKDRSAFLERAARRYLADLASAERSGRDARDKALYQQHADRLNAEAADVLEFQSLPE